MRVAGHGDLGAVKRCTARRRYVGQWNDMIHEDKIWQGGPRRLYSALGGEPVSMTGVRGAGFGQIATVSAGGPVRRRVKSRGSRVPHVTRRKESGITQRVKDGAYTARWQAYSTSS